MLQFVGPVVGEVTERTARVLVQPREAGTVRVVLTPEDGGADVAASGTATGHAPVVGLAFAGLTPATTYALRVEFDGTPVPGRTGRITTDTPGDDSAVLAAVSCNFTTRQGRARMWEALRDRWVLPGTVRRVLHVGDQIYADDAFAASLRDVELHGRTQQVRRAVRRRWRELYGHVWNHPATRAVLAHASNLMIWDDHEIRNSWGSLPEDRDPDSDATWVGTLAREVFQDYQRRLWADPDPAAPHEAHAHVYGPIGVVFLDQRGPRSFAYDPARPYLGRVQWEWLRTTLAAPAFAGVRALVVVTSVPLCYVSEGASGIGGEIVSDLRDHWSHPDHRTEQIELTTLLRRWKGAAPHRDLLVVGGDVHVGGSTRIEERGSDGAWCEVFRQLVTSPITNEPPSALFFFAIEHLLLDGWHPLSTNTRFDHERFTRRRNFAVLTLRAPVGQQATIRGSLTEDALD